MKKLSIAYLKNMLDMRTKLFEALRCDLDDALDKLHHREMQLAATELERNNLRKELYKAQTQLDHALDRIDDLMDDKRHQRTLINDLVETKKVLRIDAANLRKALEETRKKAEWWRAQDADEDYIASLEVPETLVIPFSHEESEGEDEEEGDFVWPNSSMQVEPD